MTAPVAVVTGATSGIGQAIALDLADHGWRVAAIGRRGVRLDALRAPGREILPLRCDLRDEAQIVDAFTRVDAAWGQVDVLVNSAGLGRKTSLVDGDAADWREMLDVNVLGLLICTREAVSRMRARGDRGHVVHISSMSGHRVVGGGGVYAATKHAVRALTESLRQELRELGSGIRVASLSPGFVETEFAGVYHRDPNAGATTYGRFTVLHPSDVAEAVRFVLTRPPHMEIHDMLVRPTHQPT